jgi:hypothetical protein
VYNHIVILSWLAVVFVSGCSEPDLVVKPTAESLKPYLGKTIIVEGTVVLEKRGDVVATKGMELLVHVPNELSSEWPDDGKRVRVTAMLEAQEIATYEPLEYSYVLRVGRFEELRK